MPDIASASQGRAALLLATMPAAGDNVRLYSDVAFHVTSQDLDPAADLRRLRWRCRRGMRELDQLFERWLAHDYPAAGDAERGVFLRLLDCEDDRLWRWFMGYEACPDAELAALIVRIRALPA